MHIYRKKQSHPFLYVLLVLFLIFGGWIISVRFEGEKPSAAITPIPNFLGETNRVTLDISDKKSGLRNHVVTLETKNKTHILSDWTYPASGLFKKNGTHTDTVHLNINPPALGIKDGEAVFRLKVRDYSWRGWLKGNETLWENTVKIDTRKPRLDVLTRMHNIKNGGAAMVIYQLREDCPEHGVLVGDQFYKGYPGLFNDASIQVSFYALPHDLPKSTPIKIKAVDSAGNETIAVFYSHVRYKKYQQDTINISDRFLDLKMPEFESDNGNMAGKSRIEQFLQVNREFRKANYNVLTRLHTASEPIQHWRGGFLRLPNAARRAGFADHRTYIYDGKSVDRQFHLGIDLASLVNSVVPSANAGKVIFAEPIGIYGKTVVIDHGFGLISLYSHLSDISVSAEQMVEKGDSLGRTGATGLAGGDHLHFAMMIQNTFVDPVEWWDEKWIVDNITSKLEAVKELIADKKG